MVGQIAKRLGVTDAGLDCLVRAVANGGVAEGQGFMRAQGARGRLEKQRLIAVVQPEADPSLAPNSPADTFMRGRGGVYMVTDAGRALVADARKQGY